MQANQDSSINRNTNALEVGGSTGRAVPPPPASTFGRAPITPVTAAVGLIVAGFAAGLLLIAMLVWIRASIDWDFRLKDVIMVWLARRRLMPVVPRNSLPRASTAVATAATAAVAQDAEQGEQAGAGAQQPDGNPATAAAGPEQLSAAGGLQGQRSARDEGGSRRLASRTSLELATQGQGQRDGRCAGGRAQGGRVVPVIDVNAAGGQAPGPSATDVGPSEPPVFRAVLVGGGG